LQKEKGMRTITIALCSYTLLCAENHASNLSSQGFTGLINTPNAQVIKEENITLQFNNQFDNHLRRYNKKNQYSFEENYIFGIGFIPSFEFVGRLVEAPNYTRDLSANFKFQLPYHHKYIPNIAIGIQDFGGAANFYDNTYIVTDKTLWFTRVSLGYGKSGDNVNREYGKNQKLGKRMNGIFGGIEAKITDYFSIMGEHDGKENHTAARIAIPSRWLSSVKLEATIAQNLTESQTHFALNLTIPLSANNQKIPYSRSHKQEKKHTNKTVTYTKKIPPKLNYPTKKDNILLIIQNKLIDFGFENVQVGKYNDSIYVKCENSIFDHTDLDALGYIIGTITSHCKINEPYIITLLKNNLQTITISGESQDFQNYLENPTLKNSTNLKENLQFFRTFDESNIQFITSRKNSSFFKPRVEFSPGLLTVVGSEIGVFDYLATLRTNLYMPVYDGVVISGMYEVPLLHSNNFDDDKAYGIRHANRLKNRLVTAMVHQTSHYKSFLNTLSIGKYQADFYGILNQTNFTTTSGKHGIGLKLGSFQYKNRDMMDDIDIYLSSYRYFYQPLNLYTELMYGQYWNQDRGTTIQFKRFFDQTSVAFYLKDVGYKYAGIEVSFPLTSRKLYPSKILKIKGKSDFKYGLRTTLKEPSGGNIQRPNGGLIPESDFELTNTYLDKDRLNGNYIQENIARMRNAYIIYK
jgi:hypothetical protein